MPDLVGIQSVGFSHTQAQKGFSRTFPHIKSVILTLFYFFFFFKNEISGWHYILPSVEVTEILNDKFQIHYYRKK